MKSILPNFKEKFSSFLKKDSSASVYYTLYLSRRYLKIIKVDKKNLKYELVKKIDSIGFDIIKELANYQGQYDQNIPAYLCLDTEFCITFIANRPSNMKNEELESSIALSIKTEINQDIDSSVFDYDVIQEHKPNTLSYLVVLGKKFEIREIVDSIYNMGFNLRSVTYSIPVLLSVIMEEVSSPPYSLVYLTAEDYTIVYYNDKSIIYTNGVISLPKNLESLNTISVEELTFYLNEIKNFLIMNEITSYKVLFSYEYDKLKQVREFILSSLKVDKPFSLKGVPFGFDLFHKMGELV